MVLVSCGVDHEFNWLAGIEGTVCGVLFTFSVVEYIQGGSPHSVNLQVL